MKPSICRTKQRVYIPSDDIACADRDLPIERVTNISDVTPQEGHAYFDADGLLWGYLNREFVKLNARPISWGDIQGDITNQSDLKTALAAYIKSVTYNGTKLTGENVSLEALVGVKLNGTELSQEDHKVNIDLSDYALAENVPTEVSQLTNDSGYVTMENVSQQISDAINGSEIGAAITYCTKEEIDKIFSEGTNNG